MSKEELMSKLEKLSTTELEQIKKEINEVLNKNDNEKESGE